MKAEITQLWDTRIEIITVKNGDDNNQITSLSELKKCENVLVGKKTKGVPSYLPTEILIDDEILYVSFRDISHPMGGRIRICEIIY